MFNFNITYVPVNVDDLKEEFAKAKTRSKIGAVVFTAIVVGAAALVALKIAAIAFTVIGVIAAFLVVGCIVDLCTLEGRFQTALQNATNIISNLKETETETETETNTN